MSGAIRRLAGIAVAVSSIALHGCACDPDAAMREFYGAKDVAEDQLMDPLIACGKGVVPKVLAAIQDKGMRRRGYAILFLGNGRYREAVPVLERILADDSEETYFRMDALDAITQIDPDRGRLLAGTFTGRTDDFGHLAREIADGTRQYERRGSLKALLGRHD